MGYETISEKDIDFNVDYYSLGLLESALGHELKGLGKTEFLKKYETNIEEYRKDWSLVDFCFLLGFLGYYDKDFYYDPSVRLDKYVIDVYNMFYYENKDDPEVAEYLRSFDDMYSSSLECMRNRGFLWETIDEAV